MICTERGYSLALLQIDIEIGLRSVSSDGQGLRGEMPKRTTPGGVIFRTVTAT